MQQQQQLQPKKKDAVNKAKPLKCGSLRQIGCASMLNEVRTANDL